MPTPTSATLILFMMSPVLLAGLAARPRGHTLVTISGEVKNLCCTAKSRAGRGAARRAARRGTRSCRRPQDGQRDPLEPGDDQHHEQEGEAVAAGQRLHRPVDEVDERRGSGRRALEQVEAERRRRRRARAGRSACRRRSTRSTAQRADPADHVAVAQREMDGERERRTGSWWRCRRRCPASRPSARCGRSRAPSRRRRRRGPRRPGTGCRRGSGRLSPPSSRHRQHDQREQRVDDGDVDRPDAGNGEHEPGDALRDRPVQPARDEAVAGLAGGADDLPGDGQRAGRRPVAALDPRPSAVPRSRSISRERGRRERRAVADPQPDLARARLAPAPRTARAAAATPAIRRSASRGRSESGAAVVPRIFRFPTGGSLPQGTPRGASSPRKEAGSWQRRGRRRRHPAAQPPARAAGPAQLLSSTIRSPRGWRGCCVPTGISPNTGLGGERWSALSPRPGPSSASPGR